MKSIPVTLPTETEDRHATAHGNREPPRKHEQDAKGQPARESDGETKAARLTSTELALKVHEVVKKGQRCGTELGDKDNHYSRVNSLEGRFL